MRKTDYIKEFKSITRNRSYILLTISFTCLYGIYNALGSIIAQVTKPYGFNSTDNSIFGVVFILFGVIGSFLMGYLLDKYQRFKLTVILCTSLSSLFIVASFFTLTSGNTPIFSVNLAFLGFTIIPVIPTSFAFSVELTYPVSESISNGMMILVSQIFGTILGLIAAELSTEEGSLGAVALMLAFSLTGTLSSLFVVEDLRRLKSEH